MRTYETIFILDPSLSDDRFEEEIKGVEDFIKSKNGNILRIDRWGKRKFSYPIAKKSEGYYVFMLYESNPDLPKELESHLRLNESCFRFLTVVSEEEVEQKEKA